VSYEGFQSDGDDSSDEDLSKVSTLKRKLASKMGREPVDLKAAQQAYYSGIDHKNADMD